MRIAIRDLEGTVVERGVVDGLWEDPGGGSMLDLSSKWCVPGLVDAHAHLSQDSMADLSPGEPTEIAARAFAAVERGVFLVFDKGWCDTGVLSLRDRPPAVRPHFEAAGRIVAGPHGYLPGFAHETDDEGLADVVRDAAAASGGWVKLIGDWPQKGRGPVLNFSEEAITRAVGVAHAAGCRVAIHTMADGMPSIAVRAGVDSIEHGLYLTDDDVRTLGARGGPWVPTVLQMETVRDQFGPERTAGRVISEGLDRVSSLLPSARRSGVTVLTGSDLAVPTSRVAEEAARLVALGLDHADAVWAATTAGREAMGLSLGFDVGVSADVVAFDRNPIEDIAVLSEPIAVVRAGRVHRSPS